MVKKDIGIIVGSMRKDSYNLKIGKYIINNYMDLANYEIIDIKEFPVFNEDLEKDVPKSVLEARNKIKEKDGIIFITPEYNHSIPGGLKNALDWFSRDDYCLMKKPYLLMGASDGTIGTTRSQAHLRQVLNSGAFQMYSISNNEFLFAKVQDKIDENGNIINDYTLKKLNGKLNDFNKFIDAIKTL